MISIKTGDRNGKVVCIKQVKNVKRGERVVAVDILSATESPGKYIVWRCMEAISSF